MIVYKEFSLNTIQKNTEQVGHVHKRKNQLPVFIILIESYSIMENNQDWRELKRVHQEVTAAKTTDSMKFQ